MTPRITLSQLAVIAVFALVVVPRAAIPLIDGDVWWHIRAGNEVLDTGRVPAVDSWSIVGAGEPWTSQDWLSNVVMALGDRAGTAGWWLLSLLYAALVAGALVMLRRAIALRNPGAGWFGPLIWLVIGLTVAGPTLGVRAQVVDLPLAALVLWLLAGYLRDRRWRWLIGLPLVAAVWANLHAGWVLLFLLGGAVLVGEVLDLLLRRGISPGPMPPRDLARLLLALVVSAAALVLNPNGLDLYRYPFETAGIAAHRDFLAEWSPPSLDALPGQLLLAFVLLAVLPALVVRFRRLRAADALVMVGLTVMAAYAARFLLLAPLVAALVAVTLDPVLSSSGVGRRIGPILARFERPHQGAAVAVNAVLAAAVMLLGFGVVWLRAGPDAQRAAVVEHMPVAAVDWILANDPGDRPFNQYSWGGYLGLRQPDELVYIDGRSDIYGDAPIRAYAEAVTLTADPAALLDGHRIDYVLFAIDQPLAEWLDESPGWERVYADELAAVWIRRSP